MEKAYSVEGWRQYQGHQNLSVEQSLLMADQRLRRDILLMAMQSVRGKNVKWQ